MSCLKAAGWAAGQALPPAEGRAALPVPRASLRGIAASYPDRLPSQNHYFRQARSIYFPGAAPSHGPFDDTHHRPCRYIYYWVARPVGLRGGYLYPVRKPDGFCHQSRGREACHTGCHRWEAVRGGPSTTRRLREDDRPEVWRLAAWQRADGFPVALNPEDGFRADGFREAGERGAGSTVAGNRGDDTWVAPTSRDNMDTPSCVRNKT